MTPRPALRVVDPVRPLVDDDRCHQLPCMCGLSCPVPVWGSVGFARGVLGAVLERDGLDALTRSDLERALDVLHRAADR